jgi:hypothetical protein
MQAISALSKLDFGVAELFRFPRFSEVAEAVKVFGGHRDTLEMLDAFRYLKSGVNRPLV